jgi:hypothetical protein
MDNSISLLGNVYFVHKNIFKDEKTDFVLGVYYFVKLTSTRPPKLVVGIVVDQMKMEYLYRFSDDFSQRI